jgi:putative membrane protein
MGAADIIPGVSGGTVAFMTGIYSEFLHSLNSIDAEAFRLLKQWDIARLWKKINGPFLATLLAGIGTSLFSIGRLMTYLLQHYPIYIRSFFFGLILISLPIVLREIKTWNISTVIAFGAGVCVAYLLTRVGPSQTPTALWFIFFAGMLAISAMVVPGFSGAFILMLMGQYEIMISALRNYEIAVIAVFGMGCLAGLWVFARFLSQALDNYHSATVALLAGVMLGSLNKVWPWRDVLEYATTGNGEQIPVFDKSVLPWHYMAITEKDPQIFQAVAMMTLGVFIVVLTEKIAARIKTKI